MRWQRIGVDVVIGSGGLLALVDLPNLDTRGGWGFWSAATSIALAIMYFALKLFVRLRRWRREGSEPDVKAQAVTTETVRAHFTEAGSRLVEQGQAERFEVTGDDEVPEALPR